MLSYGAKAKPRSADCSIGLQRLCLARCKPNAAGGGSLLQIIIRAVSASSVLRHPGGRGGNGPQQVFGEGFEASATLVFGARGTPGAGFGPGVRHRLCVSAENILCGLFEG